MTSAVVVAISAVVVQMATSKPDFKTTNDAALAARKAPKVAKMIGAIEKLVWPELLIDTSYRHAKHQLSAGQCEDRSPKVEHGTEGMLPHLKQHFKYLPVKIVTYEPDEQIDDCDIHIVFARIVNPMDTVTRHYLAMSEGNIAYDLGMVKAAANSMQPIKIVQYLEAQLVGSNVFISEFGFRKTRRVLSSGPYNQPAVAVHKYTDQMWRFPVVRQTHVKKGR